MLAELAAANAAYGIIKGFISNGKELSGCAKQISDFVFAKEQIEKKASKQKAKGGGGDLDEFMALEQIKQQEVGPETATDGWYTNEISKESAATVNKNYQGNFERLLAVRNDVGLYAEEYDPRAGRMLGNLPQAFSHVGLVNSAFNLAGVLGSDQRRAEA